MSEGFDEFIHQPLRLKIMAALSQLAVSDKARLDFSQLKQITGASDGNLGAHIAALEKAGFISVNKSFIGKRPNTSLRMTETGEAAFVKHLVALKELLGDSMT
jgi:DNA-binding MarR family transcriptional regulator